jgi:PadR family transcriptional regulator PadR
MPDGVVQGTLDMLILKTPATEPMQGYGVGLRIEPISKGLSQVTAGSPFPAFRRLERPGWIKGEWHATENNRRAKYSRLPDAGRKKLKSKAREWPTQSAAIADILEATSGEV